MGQKVNPIGFRIAVDKNWRSRWFADKRAFGDLLDEDCKIRKYIQQKFANSAVAEVRIERYANRVRINIHSARPGVIMGHKGEDIAKVREELSKKTGKEIYVEVTEVRDPDANAQLVAEGIAQQIVRRIALKRAMKRAQKVAMDLGVDGIKIFAAGRINGADEVQQRAHPGQLIVVDRGRAAGDDIAVERLRAAGQHAILDWHDVKMPGRAQGLQQLDHLLPIVRELRGKRRGVVVGQQNGQAQGHLKFSKDDPS